MPSDSALVPIFVWMYIFSGSYRQRVHEQWHHERCYYVVGDMALGALQLGVSVAVVYVVAGLILG